MPRLMNSQRSRGDARRQRDQGIGGAERHVEVEDRLLAVRDARVDEVAGGQLVDVVPDLCHDAHELIAERRRIRRPGRVERQERAQLAVEPWSAKPEVPR